MLRAILIHKNLNGNNQLFSEEHLFVDFENEEIENRLSSGGYSENGYDTTSFVGLGIINNPPKSEQGDSKNSSQAVQQTQPEVSLRDEIYNIVRKNVDSANRCWVITDDVMEKIAKQQAGA